MRVSEREWPPPRWARRWLETLSRPRTGDDLARSALVVAPHQDDETLGCGGTIIKKREVGARVHIAFMTDGSRSHPGRIDEQRLRALRRIEAHEATQALGCSEADLTFLDFRDGELARQRETACEAVIALLEQVRPEEVYVPFRHDGPADHETTFEVVYDALSRRPARTPVYEYPVWFWHRWPWIPTSPSNAGVRKIVREGRRGVGGLQHFRSSVFVGDVLNRKAAALACHRSQMGQLDGIADWPTLEDVADGAFLSCFFSAHEVFRETVVGGGDTTGE